MNMTMKLRDSDAPNKATLYFDQLSFKPDAVVLVEHKTPMSAIIGGAVGGFALLVALGILLGLWIMKRRKAKKRAEKEKIEGGSEDALTQPNPFIDQRPMSQTPFFQPGDPSLYSPRTEYGGLHGGGGGGGAPSMVQSMSPPMDLDGFARENPYLIDTVLLAKLQRARYMPGQHPSVISESEWFNRFNIDKIEYERLCEAYSKTFEHGGHGQEGPSSSQAIA
jgi:hypothetical protein